MKHRLYSYLDIDEVFFNYQFGFRHNHSAALALIDAVDNLYENLDLQKSHWYLFRPPKSI